MATRRAASTLVATLAAALAVAACSSSRPFVAPPSSAPRASAPPPATATASTTPTTVVATARPAARCALGAGYATGTTRHVLTVDGERRELLVHIPPRPTAAMRLVVDFHGAGSSMQAQAAYSGFDAPADARGFVVATPNASIVAGVRQWRFLGTHADVDFARAIVDELVAHACVDRGHIAATGISSGGAMTAALACQAADVFHAFAPVAADFYIASVCAAAPRRPILIFHGTADPLVPYDGGAAPGGLPVRPAEETARAWAAHDGCTSGPSATTLGSQVVRLEWAGCVEPVVMYRIVGGGHTWPGARIPVPRLGLTTTQVDATALMVQLFARYG